MISFFLCFFILFLFIFIFKFFIFYFYVSYSKFRINCMTACIISQNCMTYSTCAPSKFNIHQIDYANK